jgi:hypothetical protein
MPGPAACSPRSRSRRSRGKATAATQDRPLPGAATTRKQPRLSMSSGPPDPVGPGGCFVVADTCLEAAVRYADWAVAELAQGGFVSDVPAAQGRSRPRHQVSRTVIPVPVAVRRRRVFGRGRSGRARPAWPPGWPWIDSMSTARRGRRTGDWTTDRGRLDGDTVYDPRRRADAVFIPSTWARLRRRR